MTHVLKSKHVEGTPVNSKMDSGFCGSLNSNVLSYPHRQALKFPMLSIPNTLHRPQSDKLCLLLTSAVTWVSNPEASAVSPVFQGESQWTCSEVTPPVQNSHSGWHCAQGHDLFSNWEERLCLKEAQIASLTLQSTMI